MDRHRHAGAADHAGRRHRAHALGRLDASTAFKVGINKPRSRGDREEPFGGRGASWKGCFVGGELLVQPVTTGEPGERLYGNFPDYTSYPQT